MFMETKTVRIVDLWKNHPVRLITNKSVGIDTIVENVTGICKTTSTFSRSLVLKLWHRWLLCYLHSDLCKFL